MKGNLTVNVRLLIGGASVASWRVWLLGRVARLLCVPVEVTSERGGQS